MTILTARQAWRHDPVPAEKQHDNRLSAPEREHVLAYLVGRHSSGDACAMARGIRAGSTSSSWVILPVSGSA